MKNQIALVIQSERTGNKFLQRGVFSELKEKLSTPIFDSQAESIYKFLIEPEDGLPNTLDFELAKPCILSFTWKYAMENDDLAQRVDTHLPDTKIIFIVRSQITSLQSYYKYVYIMKFGRVLNFKNFLKEIFKSNLYDYNLLVDHYLKSFGDERIKILFFEDMKNDVNSYLEEVLSSVDLHIDQAEIDRNKLYKNESPQNSDVFIALIINRLFYPLNLLFPSKLLSRSRLFLIRLTKKILQIINIYKYLNVDLCKDQKILHDIEQRYSKSNDEFFRIVKIPKGNYDYP